MGPYSSVSERQGRIILSLSGHYTGEQAADGVAIAAGLFRRLGKSEFVVDLTDLTGYDTDARLLWQNNLADFQSSIHTVTMVGGSPLARMSGAAVCLFAGIKMRFVNRIEDVFAPPSRRAG